jgi:hypothetical protein
MMTYWKPYEKIIKKKFLKKELIIDGSAKSKL